MRDSNIRYLWPYIKQRPIWLWGSLFYAAVGATASAFGPYVLGRAVDELNGPLRIDVIAMWAALILGLALVVALLRYLLRMLTGSMAATVSYQMSQDMFARLLVLDQRTYREYGTGDLLSRATGDFIYIWRFFSAGFQMFLNAFFLFVIGTSLMATANVPLALTITALLVGSVALQLRLGGVLEHSFDRVQAQMARISGYAQEHLNAVRMLKAYAQEGAVVARFAGANDEFTRRNLHFVIRSGAIGPLPGMVIRLAATVVLVVGGTLVIGKSITLGDYVQFIVYLNLLSPAAVQMSNAFERLQQGSAAAGRIAAILRRVPRIADAPDARPAPADSTLQFRGVGVRPQRDAARPRSGAEADAAPPSKDRWILRDLNLTIPAGSTVGIVGTTGVGKTTLLGLLARVQDPDEGAVLLGGADLRSIELRDLRAGIAYVPQETLLFSMSLRDNITLGLRDVPDERVMEAMDVARLSNDLPQLPHGLDTVVGEKGATLSGGQRQRTAIARALVRRPRLLILDDALASVDANTAAQILGGLQQVGRADHGDRPTVLIVAQRMGTVRHADMIVVLHDGKVSEQGSHDELLAHDGLYAEMYRRELMQAEERIDED
jgi:ATP-binding cassette subfamily B protein